MVENFYIRRGSVQPVLRVAPINDGRYDFKSNHVIANALRDAVVTFSMRERENGRLVISRAPANIKLVDDDSCDEAPVLEYEWKERDVRKPGVFYGQFEIRFNGDIREAGVDFPEGNLIVPITDDLVINII